MRHFWSLLIALATSLIAVAVNVFSNGIAVKDRPMTFLLIITAGTLAGVACLPRSPVGPLAIGTLFGFFLLADVFFGWIPAFMFTGFKTPGTHVTLYMGWAIAAFTMGFLLLSGASPSRWRSARAPVVSLSRHVLTGASGLFVAVAAWFFITVAFGILANDAEVFDEKGSRQLFFALIVLAGACLGLFAGWPRSPAGGLAAAVTLLTPALLIVTFSSRRSLVWQEFWLGDISVTIGMAWMLAMTGGGMLAVSAFCGWIWPKPTAVPETASSDAMRNDEALVPVTGGDAAS